MAKRKKKASVARATSRASSPHGAGDQRALLWFAAALLVLALYLLFNKDALQSLTSY